MTKRAGKRKNRMGSQRHPPGATQRVDTLVEDHLPPRESIQLELRALREGWLLGRENMDAVRSGLMKKLATLASKEDDPDRLCRIVRTLAMSEQRELMIEIARQRLERPSELPEQIDSTAREIIVESKPAFAVVQELIARKDVRSALDRRPAIADQSSSQSVGRQVPAGSPS